MSLQQLQKIFEAKGWKTFIEEQSAISPRQLVIPLKDEIALRLTLCIEEGISFLQFFILFPVEVKNGEALSRLILSVNSGLDMGGFGFMEKGSLFFYRFVQIYDTFSEKILEVYFESISYLIDEYVPTMMEVAKGEKSIEQLQKEAEISQEIGSL